MSFVRRVRSAAVTAAIQRWTADMVRQDLRGADLAPRVCFRCRGAQGRACPCCGGSGTTRRFCPEDRTLPVLVSGPCGSGEQSLVSVALAGGGIGYVHVRRDGAGDPVLYLPQGNRAGAAGHAPPRLKPVVVEMGARRAAAAARRARLGASPPLAPRPRRRAGAGRSLFGA